MNRKEFLVSILSVGFAPLLRFRERYGQWKSPRVLIVCLGDSGRRIWTHLIANRPPQYVKPLIVDNERATSLFQSTFRPRKLVLVSALDDELLTRTLAEIETSGTPTRHIMSGYFISPSDREGRVRWEMANGNRDRVRKLVSDVRIVNLPDYPRREVKARTNTIWLDDQITQAEKFIVVDVLDRWR